MPQFNPDKLEKLISELRVSSERLRLLKELDKKSFLNDPDKIGSAKYQFIVAIECAIDICNHLISLNGYRAPKDYADTFQILAEKGAFEDHFASALKEMARFRNRLIHLYWEVDDERVFEILQTRQEDLKAFVNSIAKFLALDKP